MTKPAKTSYIASKAVIVRDELDGRAAWTVAIKDLRVGGTTHVRTCSTQELAQDIAAQLNLDFARAARL